MQLHCTVTQLLCILFFDSLLHDIDLCQLEASARRFQIGWCSRVIWDECLSVIFGYIVLRTIYACSIKRYYLFIIMNLVDSYTKNKAAGIIEPF